MVLVVLVVCVFLFLLFLFLLFLLLGVCLISKVLGVDKGWF